MTDLRVRLLVAALMPSVVLLALLGSGPLKEFVYYGSVLPVCGLAWWGALRRPAGPSRRPWLLSALALSLWTVGDVAWTLDHFGVIVASTFGPAEIGWLLGYPVLGAAVVLMVLQRAPGQLRASLLDGLTLTTAAGIASWQLLVAPQLEGSTEALALMVYAFYPFADVVLLAGVLLLVLSPGPRGAPTQMLIGAFVLIFVSDVGYTVLPTLVSDEAADRLAGVLVLSKALIAASSVHPRSAELTTPSHRTQTLHPARVLFLGVGLLTAPAMVLVHSDTPGREQVVLLAATIVASGSILARFASAVREQERSQRLLAYQAAHDPLTELVNRRTLTDRLEPLVSRTGRGAVLLYVDLDGFKRVNDGAGHEAGDAVLVEVARRLSAVVRDTDLVARLGGDEFAVLCPGAVPVEVAVALAERVLADVATPMYHAGRTHHIGASIGIAVAPPGTQVERGETPSAGHLLRSADAAMYEAKRLGRGRWTIAGTEVVA